jgi:tRNA pseudouridine32 synthase/23S rRNA pseudouridine746 synthase
VQARYPDARIVHRLDLATSGLLALARGREAERQLSIAFQRRQVGKEYVAVVAGQLARQSGRIELPLITDWPRRPRQKVDFEGGKPSLTLYRTIAAGPGDTTRLGLAPVTGRSHQLRVHLAAIGHPILGDELYAPAEAAAPRLLLHATRLRLPHPLSGATLEFASPAPF